MDKDRGKEQKDQTGRRMKREWEKECGERQLNQRTIWGVGWKTNKVEASENIYMYEGGLNEMAK